MSRRLLRLLPWLHVFAATSCALAQGLPTDVRLPVLPTPSGIVNTSVPSGDDGTAAAPLIWDNVCLATKLTFVAGTGSSVTILPCLSHPVSGYTVSWTDPGITGLTFNAGTGTATCSTSCPPTIGTVLLQAQYSTLNALAQPAPLTITAPAGTDTLAPTTPLGIGTVAGNGTITLNWDASADPVQPSGLAGSGIDHYEILDAGSHVSNITAPAGISVPFAPTTLGSFSPSPVYSKSGSSISIGCAGSGIHAVVSVQACLEAASVSGDVQVWSSIPTFTAANEYATAGVGFWSSLAANAPFFSIEAEPSNVGNHGVQCKAKLTSDAASANISTGIAGTDAPVKIKASVVGTSFTGYYSRDGSTWNVACQVAIPAFSALKNPAVFLSSQSAGTQESVTFNEVGLSASPALSSTITTTGTHPYSLKAYDITGNISGASLVVSGTAAAVSQAKRYYPGLYVESNDKIEPPGYPAGYLCSYITSLSAHAVGWMQLFTLAAVATAPGVYDFSQLDPVATCAATASKRFAFSLLDRSFGSASNYDYVLPSWLKTAGTNGGSCIYQKPSGVILKLWDPKCVDIEIGAEKAIIAHFEPNTLYEALETEESDTGSLGNPVTDATYSPNAYMAGLYRIIDSVAPSAKLSTFIVKANFVPTGQTGMAGYVNHIWAAGAALGNSDVKAKAVNTTANFGHAEHVAHGDGWNASFDNGDGTFGKWVASFGGATSYVNLLSLNSDVQTPDLGGGTGHPTIDQLYDEMHNLENLERAFIVRKVAPGDNCKATDGSKCGPQTYYRNADISVGTDGTGGRTTPDIEAATATTSYPMTSHCATNVPQGCTP